MNAFAIEKENRIKSGISTAMIVIFMAIMLWLYKMNIELPTFPAAPDMEVAIEPLADGGPGGEKNQNSVSVPVETNSETPDSRETSHHQAPAVVTPVEPTDNSIENMRRNRERAHEAQTTTAGHNTTNNHGDEGNDKRPHNTEGNKTGPGVSSTFSGRSFIGGNTSTDCHQAGKVVLDVQLLPNGQIVFMDVDPATDGSDCLVKAAKEILANSRFNSSVKPASNGSITFVFRLK